MSFNSQRRILAVMSSVFIMGGIIQICLWSSFGALYTPLCREFRITSSEARCQNPAIGVAIGYGCIGIGALLVVLYIALRLRQRCRSAGKMS